MSEVVMASCYGFCNGVRAAVSKAMATAEKAASEGRHCYLFGDIVHSRRVMAGLEAMGAVRIDSPEGHEPGYLVIRAHGIGDDLRRRFSEAGFIIVDATCPVVLRNMEKLRAAGNPLIIGRADHAEIQALLGCRHAPVAETAAELEALGGSDYQAIVQTTFPESALASMMETGRIASATPICRASEERRAALRDLMRRTDAIAVVGDSISANTVELARIASENGAKSFLVASASSLPQELLCYNRIGLTAGASAPDELIEEVRRSIEANV